MLLESTVNVTCLGEEKMKTKEDKKMVKLDFYFIFPSKNCSLWTCIKKIIIFTLGYMVIPFGPHSDFTYSLTSLI